jgi:hypothetical protein
MPRARTLHWVKDGIHVIAPEQVNHGRVLVQSIDDWTGRNNGNLTDFLKHVTGRAQSNDGALQQALGLLPSNLFACPLC